MSSHPKPHFFSNNFLTNLFWKVIDLLAYTFKVFATSYYDKSIGSEYRKEYKKYEISSEDTVLHIGCGIFPLTEITLAQETKAKVTGIDKDKNLIEKATKSVQQYGLEEHIRILHGFGEFYPLSYCTVIIISSCASSKINIITNMLKFMKPGSKIIIRELESFAPSLFKKVEKNDNLSYFGSMSHNPFPFFSPFGWESRCYIKK
jgi:2-polyprenyl-3-methyl-5-hydroxy-6-metoxy-1,4-benzoquinol methylase